MQSKGKKIQLKVEKPEESNEKFHLDGSPKKSGKDNIKKKKKKRLIIRNLSFKVTEEELQKKFSKFGNVLEVHIPLSKDGKKRGFAFVEFDNMKSLVSAMKALNFKEIHGRQVSIDFCIDKTSHQLKLQNIKQEHDDVSLKTVKEEVLSDLDEESDEEKPDIEEDDSSDETLEECDEKKRKANEFLKEFESGFEDAQDEDDSDEFSENESEKDENDSDDETEDEVDDEIDEEDSDDASDLNVKKKPRKLKSINKDSSKKVREPDIAEGKTVFLRNVSFSTTKESLEEAMEKYGELYYCVICMDPFTDYSKGTAFVKFREKESANKLIEESYHDPGVMVDGRKLTCSLAMAKNDIIQRHNVEKKPKDKRNLNLLKVGLVMRNTPESEGVSRFDMAKRAQLEMVKKQKLKNVNFFVSDKRLIIHNLPKTMNDVQLKNLFHRVTNKRAVITEARVMKEFKKTNSEGMPLSKGFGFVSFNKHEDAIKALLELNNNPTIFTDQKRPIVEFSVENKMALLSKERRKEKMQQRNKKRTEEKYERKTLENKLKKNETKTVQQQVSKKNKKRKRQTRENQASETGNNECEKNEMAQNNSKRSGKGKPKKFNKGKRKQKFGKKGKSVEDGIKKKSVTNQKNFKTRTKSFKQKFVNKK